jgi:hypothetical protein
VFGLVSLGLLAIEAFGSLKNGTWNVIVQVEDVVMLLVSTKHARWLSAPTDWLGLHAIVSPLLRVPLWLPSGVLSAVLIGAGINDLHWAPFYDAIDPRGPKGK